ncbi:hypothetical protein QNE29_004186 [Vibrio vulnificus]|nr:hypothetical protein [Vibrio vulnificus]
MKHVNYLSLLVSAVLVGCGGGGDSSTPKPPPEPTFQFSTPISLIRIDDANWQPSIVLPESPDHYTVEVISTASKPTDIMLKDSEWTEVVHPNEPVKFESENDEWVRATESINLLLLHSTKVDRDESQERLLESLALTNDALRDSYAEFRFRLVGFEPHTPNDDWKTLGDALNGIRADSEVQALRSQYKADAVYYLGTEEGGGLAYVSTHPDHMWAVESTEATKTTMRHELGHNLTLFHYKEDLKEGQYNSGYREEQTVMGGNTVGFFSNPNLISYATGQPYGIADEIDAVRAMNEFVRWVVEYREGFSESSADTMQYQDDDVTISE